MFEGLLYFCDTLRLMSDYYEDPWLGGNGQTAYSVVSDEACPVCGEKLRTHDAEVWFCSRGHIRQDAVQQVNEHHGQ